MGFHTSLTPLSELLYQAISVQSSSVQGHSEASSTVEAIYNQLQILLEQHSPLIITSAKNGLWHQNQQIRNAPIATQAIAKEMEQRGLNGVAFYAGIEYEELELCIFALQLPVKRLMELGGVQALAPEGSNISFLRPAPTKSISPERPAQRWAAYAEPGRTLNTGPA